jgi:hypothetical protein
MSPPGARVVTLKAMVSAVLACPVLMELRFVRILNIYFAHFTSLFLSKLDERGQTNVTNRDGLELCGPCQRRSTIS